jgi:hypothetical protein
VSGSYSSILYESGIGCLIVRYKIVEYVPLDRFLSGNGPLRT